MRPLRTSISPCTSVSVRRTSNASSTVCALSNRRRRAASAAWRLPSRDVRSTYSSVTSLLDDTSDTTSAAIPRNRPTTSSRRSAGTRTAMKPLCFSARLVETTQPPICCASAPTVSNEAATSTTSSVMSTV